MDIKVEHTIDFRALARLNESIQTWHHTTYPEDFKPFNCVEIENAFEKMLQDKNVYGFIARHKNKPIGYLIAYLKTRADSAFQYEKIVLHIDQVVVIPEYQKSGVGQLLMNEANELAKLKQVKEIQLDFWSDNLQAEIFFLRNGFKFFNHKVKK